jgi:hypothetical protein
VSKSDHGIVRNERGEEQPADKDRARAAHKSDPKTSVSHEATRDPKLNDPEKTPGSGMVPDDKGDAPGG